MPTVAFHLKGLDELNRKLQRLVQRAPSEAGKTLFREATKVIAASKELTPVDTGFLRASAHVDVPVVEGARVSVTMGYNATYALAVHERVTARHPVGRSKFLETAVLEAIPDINQAIAADFATIFREGA